MVNKCINQGAYVNAFQKVEVRLLYKKDGKTEKSNYKPISVLSNVSKIYERSLYDEIYSYFEKIFSIYQYGFCKVLAHSISFLTMIEKTKISCDNKNAVQLLWQTSQKHLTLYLATCLLLSWMQMVLMRKH